MSRNERDEEVEMANEAKRGDRSAFAVLVRRTAQRLLCVLGAMGLKTHDAEDVMQETYMRAWDRIATFDTTYRFATWLFTIARRLAVSHHRAQRPTVPMADEPVAPEVPARDTLDGRGLWKRAAAILNAQQYELMWLRYAEDMTPKEIAGVTGLTESNVRVTLHRSRGMLASLATGAAVQG